MNGDAVVGGVEVLHSSRVSDEKFRFLEKNLPWCEVCSIFLQKDLTIKSVNHARGSSQAMGLIKGDRKKGNRKKKT